MSDYPANIVPVDHVEPVPRRIRAVLAGRTVLDTTRALYVWEVPYYPQFYVPLADVEPDVLVDEDHKQDSSRGTVAVHGLRVGDAYRPRAAKVLRESPIDRLTDTVRFDFKALDSWYEEDERIFVHPRSPYARIDCVRSSRRIRIELEGVVLAESASPVMLFETGLPTRYYLNRTDLAFEHLVRSDTETACPYKGTTGAYWSARIGERLHKDVAWTYDFTTLGVQPIAGLVAFYNERVDIFVDDVKLERPGTPF
jgi:uncharacterized protein (DUF427 family)